MADSFIDDFFYAPSDIKETKSESTQKWKVMIVDDEAEVHQVTTLTLEDFVFEGKGIEFIHAYSGKEAMRLIEEHPDTALIFLDVVMESDDAGLKVAKYIRETAKNFYVRIILRTGHPGQAPEKEVVLNYDINDYKEKEDLTIQKLFTSVVSSLRSYKDIVTINNNRQGLIKIIKASSSIFLLESMQNFVSAILVQLNSILRLNPDSFFCRDSGFLVRGRFEESRILVGTGKYENNIGRNLMDALAPEVLEILQESYKKKKSVFRKNQGVFHFQTNNNIDNMVYVEVDRELDDWDKELAEIFCSNIATAFDNVYLYDQINSMYQTAIKNIAKIYEFKGTETGQQIKMISELSISLASQMLKSGRFKGEIDKDFVEQIGLSSIMYSTGKVGIPETILLKSGHLDQQEWENMKKPVVMGGEVLMRAAEKIRDRNYITIAAEITKYHREKFNGQGYPEGLKGKLIPLSARLSSIAEVFVALTSSLQGKEPWSKEKAIELIEKEAGNTFDPDIVEMLIEILT